MSTPTSNKLGLYGILGVPREATTEAIRRAFIRSAKEHHPDKGGNAVMFRSVSEAYEVLSDPVKRKHYDETGEYSTAAVEEWETRLTMIFSECLDSGDMNDDLIRTARRAVELGLGKGRTEAEKIVRDRANLVELLGRFEGPERNLMRIEIQARINTCDAAASVLEKEMKLGKRMLAELRNYRQVMPKDDYFVKPPRRSLLDIYAT